MPQFHVLTQDNSNEVIWNNYLRGGYATWEVGFECDYHSHKDAAEVFVFVDGECEITVGDHVERVPAGGTLYVGPDTAHKLKAVGDRPLKMFLAVMPNHQPTHTMHNPDGTTRDTNRPEPKSPEIWIGKID